MLVQLTATNAPSKSALDRTYVMLVSVDVQEKGKRSSKCLFNSGRRASVFILAVSDKSNRELPPRWPILPEALLVENSTYELAYVTLSSVAFVTDVVLKVGVASQFLV